MLLSVGLLAIGAGALVAAGAGSGPAIEVLGGNLPVNAGAVDPRDVTAHNSPTMARNPVDGSNIAVANRIDAPQFSCAVHVSRDGGRQWSQLPLPVPPGEEPKCFAPEVAFDAAGTLYVSFVTLQGNGNVPHAVWLVRSADKGATVTDPTQLLGPLAFQFRLVADPVAPGRLYRTWLQAEGVSLYAFPATGYPIQFARSDDGGATWKGGARVSPPSRARVVAPSLAVGPAGELVVLYLDLGDDRLDYAGGHQGRGGPPYAGDWRLVLARSTDGGRTWAETVVDEVAPTERFLVFLPPSPSLAVDRRNGRVFAAFHDGRSGDADVLLWASEDGGRTFGSPRRVNDTSPGDGTSQYLPRLSVAPGGRLDILYYDRRADPNDVRNQVSFQSSFDGGATFTPSRRLADRSFDSRIGFGSERDMPDLGSRLALVSTPQRALAVWTDTRSGTRASGKQDLVRAVVQVVPGNGPSGATRAALRAAAGVLLVAGAGVAVTGWRRRRPAQVP